jgi:hypothetical protein
MRCDSCGRLSLRDCRGSRWCLAWGRVRAKLLELVHVPEMPLRHSAGKFVVGWDWER